MSKVNGSAFSEDLVRGELARVLESPIFAQSERLGRFLRFAETDVPEARKIGKQCLGHRLQIVKYTALFS